MQISESHLENKHPFFVTVTEMLFDSTESQLQVSCKIFTDDFEETLRKTSAGKIDLLDSNLKPKMDSLVADYFGKHLQVKVDNADLRLKYLGFEQEDDAIIYYLQIDDLKRIKKIEVTDDLLFEYKTLQTNLVHVTVGGIRKSARLNNPQAKTSFEF
ncbi:MAG: DUF6702 family protein [Ginsengibacter sp.]